MMGRMINDQLTLVVGWLPGAHPRGSLASGARSLIPAVLYADKVSVICPESDDALEMSDYFTLKNALPGTVDFLALDSAYARYDENGEPVGSGPLEPEVFGQLFEQYIHDVEDALRNGDEEGSIHRLAQAVALLTWHVIQYDVESILREYLPNLNPRIVRAVEGAQYEVTKEAIRDYLLAVYAKRALQPHSYALLDDSERVLNQHMRDEAAEQIRGWAAVRSREASLSATVLRRLPSPNATEPWDVIADVRMRLQPSLRRFRVAMSEISTAAEAHPLEEDFDAYAEHVWRSRIAPALNELDELVREASLRSVFFGDVLGDLSSYAGPVIGIGAALSQALPALASAAIAAASPTASTLAHWREKRRALRRHDFLFRLIVMKRGGAYCRR
jgi:hypothetical protein